jgi:hypothetical protein
MSLKGFHLVFVSASALVAFGFAAWCVGAVPEPGMARLAGGALAVVAGLCLVGYEVWFVKKMRSLP